MYTRNKEGPSVLHLTLLLAHVHSKIKGVGLPQCLPEATRSGTISLSQKRLTRALNMHPGVTTGISHPLPATDAVMRSALVRDTTEKATEAESV